MHKQDQYNVLTTKDRQSLKSEFLALHKIGTKVHLTDSI